MEENNLTTSDGSNFDLIKFARNNALISSNNAKAIVSLAENLEGVASLTKNLAKDVRQLKKTDMYMTVKSLNIALKQKWDNRKCSSVSFELNDIRKLLGSDRESVPDLVYNEVWAYHPSVILYWCRENGFPKPSRYEDYYE